MVLRMVEVTVEPGHVDTVRAVGEHWGVIDSDIRPVGEDGRQTIRLLAGRGDRQALLDALQKALSAAQNWRIVISPVDATIPLPEPEEDKSETKPEASETREELYIDISKGAEVTANFLVLVFLSTVVAAIGLGTDTIAVVIGAMVIAPFLGPNLAFAFATALGDRGLMVSAARANLFGFALTLALSAAIGALWPEAAASSEMLARSRVGFDGLALALASGAAAVLSLTTGLSSALVGVMVAVALLPPATAMGIFIGAGEPARALGAGVLLAANVVCVNLAAQVVFLAKGLSPRTWFEKRAARASIITSLVIWGGLLAALAGVITWRG